MRTIFDVRTGEITIDEAFVADLKPITPDDVIAEAERLMALGFEYDFGDARGVHRIGTTKKDREGWDEVTQAAQAFMALGQPKATFGIVTDTGPCQVTAAEWQNVLLAAAAYRQPIWSARFTLNAQDPIPDDYEAILAQAAGV